MPQPIDKKKLRFTICVQPESETDRRVKLAIRPRHKMLALKFHEPDIAQWKCAAAKLGMSDTDFFECVMNAVSSEILRKGV